MAGADSHPDCHATRPLHHTVKFVSNGKSYRRGSCVRRSRDCHAPHRTRNEAESAPGRGVSGHHLNRWRGALPAVLARLSRLRTEICPEARTPATSAAPALPTALLRCHPDRSSFAIADRCRSAPASDPAVVGSSALSRLASDATEHPNRPAPQVRVDSTSPGITTSVTVTNGDI